MAHPRDTLLSLQANALKSLSQNFLTSPHWAEKLVSAVTEGVAPDEFWEIGPGLGALTKQLLIKAVKPIRIFEVDRKLAAYLRTEVPTALLTEGDFLKVDLATISPEAKRIAVLSNMPYHLSSPILFKLLEEKTRLTRLVLTFQKEFADRLIAETRTEAYGALSVVAQLNFTIHSLGVLPPGAFYPAPSIASEALLLLPKPEPDVGVALVGHVAKAAFSHRRKKATSNLKEVFPLNDWPAAFATLGLGENVRAEEISLDQYVALARALKT